MEKFDTQVGIAPQNYMTLAIISTILGCCSIYGIGFVVGIIGIYFASQVNSRFNSGDYEGAAKNSKTARTLSFVAIGLFFLGMILSLGVYFFYPELISEQQQAIQEMIDQMKDAQ